jgi:hypothetical protein
MRNFLFGVILTLAAAPAVYALVAAPPPGPARIARADTVVVGRIVAHEDKDVESAIPGSPQKIKYRIAVLKVNESIRGSEAGKFLRVAFYPPPVAQPGKPVLVTGGGGRINLEVGRDGLFMLTKHADGFYQPPLFYNIVASNQPNYEKEVAEARKLVKLLDKPLPGLKSEKAEERLLTAALLIFRYRTPTAGQAKQEPIDADESKLILKAVAEADWNQPRKFGQLHPQELFFELRLTKEEGWEMPRTATPQQLAQVSQAWLREHGATYRIKKYVAGK